MLLLWIRSLAAGPPPSRASIADRTQFQELWLRRGVSKLVRRARPAQQARRPIQWGRSSKSMRARECTAGSQAGRSVRPGADAAQEDRRAPAGDPEEHQ